MDVTRRRLAELIGCYAKDQAVEDAPGELVIPEDLGTLSDENLAALHGQVVESFNAVYGDGAGLSSEDVAALTALTEGIEALAAEGQIRADAAAEREAAAAALAARVNPSGKHTGGDDGFETPDDMSENAAGQKATNEDAAAAAAESADAADGADTDPAGPNEAGQEDQNAVTAGARRPAIRVNLGSLQRRAEGRQATRSQRGEALSALMASGDGTGFAAGAPISFEDAADIFERRLQAFPETSFAAAADAGRHVSQRNGLLTVRKPIRSEHLVASLDPNEVMAVMDSAANERLLPGGSLTAAGGWCAPSEIDYSLGCERESREGLFTLPEVGIRRGGLQWTQGIDFAAIFNGTGFSFTEADDIAGRYARDGSGTAVVGDKPCYRIPCPEFQEARLAVSGLCIVGGLLQLRGYPEVVSSTIRRALIAHDHKMSANILNAVIAGSTAVTYPARVGAVAPLLDSIEMQTEHYRYTHRMARATTLEAVFPFWVRGVLRSDLARRLGVDFISVPDSRIDAWFRDRNISPQYVYNLDPITGSAASFLAWPSTVRFVLYQAGTWVKGGTDIITLDTLYDSVLLGQNDYLALFSEEGWLVAQRCPDSRVVSVPLCPDGSTAAGVDIACNGIAAV